MSVNAISWSEMLAYFTLIQVTPTTEEINILRKLDNVVLKHYAKQQEEEQRKQQNKSKK